MMWSRLTRFICIPSLIFVALAAGGCGGDAEPASSGVRILHFEVDPPNLTLPGEVTISWTTAGAASVGLSVDGIELERDDLAPAAGSLSLHIATTSTIELEARSAGGKAVRERHTVEVEKSAPLPIVGELLAPARVEADEQGSAEVTLAWSGVEHAAELRLEATTLDPIVLDPDASEGSVVVSLRDDTTFTLIARNEEGEDSAEAKVRVIPLPRIVRFDGDRTRVGSGEELGIEWETEGSVELELLVDGEPASNWDPEQTLGSTSVVIWLESTLELIATNELGTSVRDTLDVTVGAPLLGWFRGEVEAQWLGESVLLSWESEGGSQLELRDQSGEILYETQVLDEMHANDWVWLPSASGAHSLQLTVSNTSGTVSEDWDVFVAPGPTIVQLVAEPEELSVGQELILSWEVLPDPSGESPTLLLEDDRGENYPLDALKGSLPVVVDEAGPLVFTLAASTSDPRSIDAIRQVAVDVRPLAEARLVATPTLFDDSVDPEVALSWTTNLATEVHIDWIVGTEVLRLIDVPEADRDAGSFTFVPREAGILRLVAVNELGHTTTDEVEISVAPTEVLVFDADTTSITQGQPVVLQWQTRMADEVRLDVADEVYLREEFSTPYIDAAKQGGVHLPLDTSCGPEIATAGCAELSLPFEFPFGDATVTTARIYTTGVISFDDSVAPPSIEQNEIFPTALPAAWVHLAPFWDSLRWDPLRYPEGNVYYLQQDGPAGRSLVIQWRDIGFAQVRAREASANFEVVLWEDGRFEYRYGQTDPRDTPDGAMLLAGSSATIGYQLIGQHAADTLLHLNTIPLLGAPAQRTFGFRRSPIIGKDGTLTLHPYPQQETVKFTLTATRGEVSHQQSVTIDVARKPFIELAPFEPAPSLVDTPFRLGWKTFNATRIEVVDAADQIRCQATTAGVVAESYCDLREETVGFYSYRVRATGAHGAVSEVTFHTAIYAPFGILAFDADRTEVESGESVLLSWESFGGSTLRLLADGVELFSEVAPSGVGHFEIDQLERNTEYVLEVTNAIGVVDERRIMLEVWEIQLSLESSSTTVRPGQPIDVTVDATLLDGGDPAPVFGNLPLAEVSSSYTDISNVLGATRHSLPPSTLAGNAVVDVTLPAGFTFPYMGTDYSSMKVFIDGYISFSPDATITKNNQRLPFAGSPEGRAVHLAPFWEDLHAWNHGQIWTAALDADTFVIQWKEVTIDFVSNATDRLNLSFQVVLSRSGAFEFRYGNMLPHVPPTTSHNCYPNTCENEANGASATIGFQWNDGRSGQTLHFGGSGLGPKIIPIADGLSNRSFRYEPFTGRKEFQVSTDVSQTLEFCSLSAGAAVCKELEVTTTDFGIDSFRTSHTEVATGQPVTLSWTTTGGVKLDIRKDGSLIRSITDYDEIDAGSWTDTPSSNTTYVLELRSGSFRDSSARPVDVSTMVLTASASPSSHPGTPITLSWNLGVGGTPTAPPFVVTPLEEITGTSGGAFADLDLTYNDDAVEIIGTTATNNAVDVNLAADGFVFNYFGVEYSKIRVATDGYISFEGTGNSNGSNQLIPNSSATYKAINLAPFWEDLNSRGIGQVLRAKIDDDTYVIQWSQMSLDQRTSDANRADLNFMVVLHRGGGFEYRYGRMDPPPSPLTPPTTCHPVGCVNEVNGSSATIGYQDPSGTMGYLLHFGGTNRAASQKPIDGGLAHRSWRFTPHSGSGSIQLRPADTTTYKVCAYDPTTQDSVCTPAVEVEVPWGIDLFEPTPSAPLPGESLSLAWKVAGLDSMRIEANGVEIASYQAETLQLMGNVSHQPTGTTTYVLEGMSLGRVVRAERQVIPRTFDLTVSGPAGSLLPGEVATIGWQATNVASGTIAMYPPLSEVDAGPGAPHAFIDVSALEGAEEVQMSNDNGFGTVSLPFTFPYLGTEQQSVQVFVDGYLSFAGAGGNSNGGASVLPEPSGRVHLAAYWKDTKMDVGGPERIWRYYPDANTAIIQWKEFNATRGSTSTSRYNLNYQVVLRSDGSFEYRYGEMKPPPPPFSSNDCNPSSCLDDANGQYASIGYQGVDGSLGSTLHYGTLEVAGGGFGEVSLLPPAGQAFAGGLSHRSFVYQPVTSGSSRVVVGRSGTHRVCAKLGDFSACKSLYIEARADQGDLAITELMINPAGGGQWIEIRNLSHREIDLEGFTLEGQLGPHLIHASLPLAPGAMATLATSLDVGFVPDYLLDQGFELHRQSDTLDLRAGTMSIASAGWGISWTIPAGESLSLDPRHHQTGEIDHSDFSQWCNGGQSGTPGSLGSGCLSDDYDVDLRSNRPFIDIAATGARFHDVEGTNLLGRLPATGFLPQHFHETYSRIWVSSNGWISFSNELPTTNASVVPPSKLPRGASGAPEGPLVSAFWDTLSCDRRAFDCRFYYELRVVDGQEVLILQWDGFQKGANGSLTFQLQLWQSGDHVVAFPTLENPFTLGTRDWFVFQGGSSWVGLEAEDRNKVETAHLKRILGFSKRSIHFQPK